MRIRELELLGGASGAKGLVVVIDVFRACSTACAIAAGRPARHIVVGDDREAASMKTAWPSALLVGKAEPGENVAYDLPNSPSRILAVDVAGRVVVHRTMAGARGILAATGAIEVLCATFPNISAVARHIAKRKPAEVSLVAIGHRGTRPCRADEACSRYLAALLEGAVPVPPDRAMLRENAGRELVDDPEGEYPAADFAFCLEVDRFDFALRAVRAERHAVVEPAFEE